MAGNARFSCPTPAEARKQQSIWQFNQTIAQSNYQITHLPNYQIQMIHPGL
jgi:hypothetical protein